jgi:hypothetical protein
MHSVTLMGAAQKPSRPVLRFLLAARGNEHSRRQKVSLASRRLSRQERGVPFRWSSLTGL